MGFITVHRGDVCLAGGKPVVGGGGERDGTLAYGILRSHDEGGSDGAMHIRFDALISHDITYVGIIQTARASGMTQFPVPYVLTNCHNSLCAVGGTINEDDHAFGLSAAIKYGGVYVPPNQAVIHQYAREALAGCGKMILGSDSHTRYGCLGALGVGEGGGELVKQLLRNTYDLAPPEVVLVWLEGAPPRGVGPHDIALALVGATFPDGVVKNKILEFHGPGIAGLPIDYRMGIDVMTTETGCLSSVWAVDDAVRAYYDNVGRPQDYRELSPVEGARYDGLITVDMSRAEPMIALPFHPSRAYAIRELLLDPERILAETEEACRDELGGRARLDLRRNIGKNGEIYVQQGIIAGCAGGTFDNICQAADILRGHSIGDGYFDLSVYPASSPISLAVTRNGAAAALMEAGAVIKPAFCGPCFGAGDTPAHDTLSIRHATRNFASREGSKPGNGQIAAVALMDARSIAATARRGGILTAATDIDYDVSPREYVYDGTIYAKRCYSGFGKPEPDAPLRLGPNIADWPEMSPMRDNLLLRLCAVIRDAVTTTDELIPSGETSSYRSNPLALAEFTLHRRCPDYVSKCKDTMSLGAALRSGETAGISADVLQMLGNRADDTSLGSCVFAVKPGDGSAREQAASCQKVLGGWANICYEYATRRYRSNCVNWGIVPFTIDSGESFPYGDGDWIFVPQLRSLLQSGASEFPATVIDSTGATRPLTLRCDGMTREERQILTSGCLMNYYKNG